MGGVYGVDGFFPEVLPSVGVISGEDDVIGDFDANVDGAMGRVGIEVGFVSVEVSREEIVPVGVGGGELVLAVFYEDVPDYDGVFDS